MRPRRRVLALLAAAVVFVGACAGTTARTTFPPLGSTPRPVGDATAATSRQVVGALAAVGFQGVDAIRQYRPPEGAILAGAPRSVLQATLPDDPAHGFIVIYALASDAAAQAAAEDQAAYVASGPGRVQFTPDAHFVLRVASSTVVFFWWSPGAALDQRTKDIEAALGNVGTEVPVRG
ncbi:MAG: hypothetical protein HYX55_07790 [Chloroflexi bacterium]|nr:hypothetical protein [Chloroflexota bacterium]